MLSCFCVCVCVCVCVCMTMGGIVIAVFLSFVHVTLFFILLILFDAEFIFCNY